MSEKMYPIPFRSLMNWIVEEYAVTGDIFGVHKAYHASGKTLPIFGERIETPFGPAAGPNSQLAQNIIAAYFAGARFFEVKTVQKMDGHDLAVCVPRPCILADDEGYNQEWSTELEVPQAMNEYIKAWCALKVLSKVYGLGDPDGFVFNMSVGYDLDGIKGEKVDTYINGMMDASQTEQFRECPGRPDRAVPGGEGLHRVHFSARQPQCHRFHAPRLPAAGDRAHRVLPSDGKGSSHLRQVQSDHSRLQDRPQHSRLDGLRLHRL